MSETTRSVHPLDSVRAELDPAELPPSAMRSARYRCLIAIDPGLDRVSLARFVVERQRVAAWPQLDAVARARSYADVEHIVTAPAQLFAHRLAAIFVTCEAMFRRHQPDLVVIETPAVGGQYTRLHGAGKRMGGRVNDTLRDFNIAIGTIIGAAVAVLPKERVQLVTALRAAKDVRLDIARSAVTKAGKVAPCNRDDLDAIAIGLTVEWPLGCR